MIQSIFGNSRQEWEKNVRRCVWAYSNFANIDAEELIKNLLQHAKIDGINCDFLSDTLDEIFNTCRATFDEVLAEMFQLHTGVSITTYVW